MPKYTKFDAADYLDSEEMIAEYLNAVLEEDDPELFLSAIADIAKAKGMTKVAEESGLGRESLYKAFAPGSHPQYETVRKVIKSLGVRLKVEAA
ncbi:MAG TPA: addiction module antidote protein [Terriglobia bacterium]|nr:addiction module antidote protein [Terriglobia bacterium]